MSDVTRILTQLNNGDNSSGEELLPLVYAELRRLASARLSNEKPGQTLQATALVHEAYVRLVDTEQTQDWRSRGHFFGAAAEAMRRILIENARRKASLKHGGDLVRVELTDEDVANSDSDAAHQLELLAVDEALGQLEREHPGLAQIVKLKFFAGLTLNEISEAVGRSRASTQRDWTFARAWLFGKLDKS